MNFNESIITFALLMVAFAFLVIIYTLASATFDAMNYRHQISFYCEDFQVKEESWKFYCFDKNYIEEYYCGEKQCLLKK